MDVVTFNFEKKDGKAIYLQLYDTIVRQMMDGFILQGERLPSIRQLAKQLNLSKSTIENTYDKLVSEGYLVAKAKSGFYCDIPELKKKESIFFEPIFDNRDEPAIRFDFSSRSMELNHFDTKVWRRYTRYVLEHDQMIASYGNNQGEPFLREQLSSYLFRERGVISQPNQLVIGAGIQPLLYLFCSLFRDTSLRVGFLRPVFKQAVTVFADCHHQIVEIDSLAHLKNYQIDVLYLTPALHDLKMRQRVELLNYLRENSIYLIEDDHNGEMHYLSPASSSIQGLFADEQIFYLSSFSKLLLPSVRLACMVIPEGFQTKLLYRLPNYNQTASKIEQHVLALYIQDGHLERRVKRLKKLYQKKSEVMLQALLKYFSLHQIKRLETSLCYEIDTSFSEKFYTRAKKLGISLSDSHSSKLLLYYGGIALEDIVIGVDQLFSIG